MELGSQDLARVIGGRIHSPAQQSLGLIFQKGMVLGRGLALVQEDISIA
jgi:hypothetical protein